MDKILKLSVHQLVDFLLRKGDIDNRVFNKTTMSEGTRLHLYHQSKQKKNYFPEYYLLRSFFVDDFMVTLDGRADGVIIDGDNITIDEIKSTIVPLDEFYKNEKEWHLGQAKCYAAMYGLLNKIDKVNVQLTYIHQITNEKMIKSFSYLTSELNEYVIDLIREYLEFYKFLFTKTEIRNESAGKLEFPFANFRAGQKMLAKYAYGIAINGGTLFVKAPTGIGKTISTLYPTVKSFAQGENEKIFYLTAKTSGKEMAYDTVKLLLDRGLKASAIIITAKDKICPCPGKACNPDDCPFAKDYYTKIRHIITESINEYNLFSPSLIMDIAKRYAICPFELSLDLSLYVDIIICDYNYLFDPLVYLKRYFDENAGNMIALVDESHNLVERGRSMYSATLNSYSFGLMKKSIRHLEHKKIKNTIKRISKIFNYYEDYEEGDTIIDQLDQKDLNGINAFLLAASDVMKHHPQAVSDEFTDFFFELNKFYKLYDFIDETFTLYVTKTAHKDTKINLFCIDPSKHIKRALNKVKGKIIFSATLSPTQYYIDMIGGAKSDPLLDLASPFLKENLDVLVAPTISIRYRNRDKTFRDVADYIKSAVKARVGNYFVYVPSYEYLNNLVPYLEDKDINLMVQEKDMSDIEKEQFLSVFTDKPKETVLGVAVVGGAFGEGIDLVSERLVGVIVVGVGLPQLCFERDLIRSYFDKVENDGYNYAYVSPGINKVLQAVGRVIRSEKDKGIALLIDDRYLSKPYIDLFQNEWPHYRVVTSPEDVTKEVDNFWNKK